ncbi:MAG: histidinol dehydrogenase, partial [Planctomycetota bacterium]
MRTITIEEAEGLRTHTLVRRPEIEARVRDIIADVGARGGAAVTELRAQHDVAGRAGDPLELGASAFEAALLGLKGPLRQALEGMATRVRTFAQAQRAAVLGASMETIPGARCEQRVQPIARVGCYVPGGAHPLPS